MTRLERVSRVIRKAVFDDLPRGQEFKEVNLEKTTTDFTTEDGVTYRVIFTGDDPYTVEFGPVGGTAWSVNKFEVLSKVAGAIKTFISEWGPSNIGFKAARPELVGVYRKMLERFFPGQWKQYGDDFHIEVSEEDDIGPSI